MIRKTQYNAKFPIHI